MRLKYKRFSSEELLLIRKLTKEGKSLDNLASIFDRFKIRYKRTIKKREERNDLHLIRVYRDELGFSITHKLEKLNNILAKN